MSCIKCGNKFGWFDERHPIDYEGMLVWMCDDCYREAVKEEEK